ncbi:MAG TPA: C-GCAxxG-C-C family protein [Methanoregulaceae archaeon]|nr:C-GCAxxG-C-C family protein [Methanoregulaceae archaeon]
MDRADEAVACFFRGFSCSQAVFLCYAKESGLDSRTALKLSCGFGAGIARTGEICGAVSGAIMVIGLRHGRDTVEDKDARDTTYKIVQQFLASFAERNGSVNCRELIGHDLSDPESYDRAAKSGVFTTKCPALVRGAVEVLEEIL